MCGIRGLIFNDYLFRNTNNIVLRVYVNKIVIFTIQERLKKVYNLIYEERARRTRLVYFC